MSEGPRIAVGTALAGGPYRDHGNSVLHYAQVTVTVPLASDSEGCASHAHTSHNSSLTGGFKVWKVLLTFTFVLSIFALFTTETAAAETDSLDCPPTVSSDEAPIPAEQINDGVDAEACQMEGRIIAAGNAASEENLFPGVGGAISAVVPREGESVHAEALHADGAIEMEIVHGSDGIVSVEVHDDLDSDDQTGGGGAGSDTACNNNYDSKFWPNWSGHESDEQKWWFKSTSRPSYLNSNKTITALKRGSQHWESNFNDCGIGDSAGIRERFLGTTSHPSNITPDGTCASSDGYNIVTFGAMSGSRLATACTWRILGEISEGDIKFDTSGTRWWVETHSYAGCTDEWDLEGVMTHERGHNLSWLHSPESGWTEDWTMSPNIEGRCNNWERTLGRGEATWNNSKY